MALHEIPTDPTSRNAPVDFWALVQEHARIEAIPNDQSTEDDFDRAGDLWIEIMGTPAPDARAVRLKVDWFLSDAAYIPEYLAQTRADLDRFLAPAGAA